jgi:heme-degrading monooxygenase HmoA
MHQQGPSYFAVIFISQFSSEDDVGYSAMAVKMTELSSQQKGFRGMETVRDESGKGITVSYWDTMEDISAWRKNAEHAVAQKAGRDKYYGSFKIQICKVEREYSFGGKPS